MCDFCDNYDFGRVGYKPLMSGDAPYIYFPGVVGDVPEDRKFKFCPVCGSELTEENFNWPVSGFSHKETLLPKPHCPPRRSQGKKGNEMLHKNNLIFATLKGKRSYLACPVQYTKEFVELLQTGLEREIDCEVFAVGTVPLESLPEDIQAEVKNTLKAFDRVTVTYEYGGFNVSTGACIRASYPWDHFVCGDYRADRIYTKDERRANFIESFGYESVFL